MAGDEPEAVHQSLAAALDACFDRIEAIRRDARDRRGASAIDPTNPPRWPAIVMRTPKGWTGPAVVGGLPVEGTFRAHQVPLPLARTDAEQCTQLETWLRSYEPENLFDESGALVTRVGKYVTIWRREYDGTWKVLLDGGSPDERELAPPAAPTVAPPATAPPPPQRPPQKKP